MIVGITKTSLLIIGGILLVFFTLVLIEEYILYLAVWLVSATIIAISIIAAGTHIGGVWAQKNITDIKSAKNVAFWSAFIFFIGAIIFAYADSQLLSIIREGDGLWTLITQRIVQSLAIYFGATMSLRQHLNKKTDSEII